MRSGRRRYEELRLGHRTPQRSGRPQHRVVKNVCDRETIHLEEFKREYNTYRTPYGTRSGSDAEENALEGKSTKAYTGKDVRSSDRETLER